MRNKHGYTHIGGQLPRKLSASEALGAAYGAPRIPGVVPSQAPVWDIKDDKFEPARYRKGPTLANFIAQNRHAEAEMHRIHQAALDVGFTQGVQDEMIAPSSWSDTQLAALVADMRNHEEVKVSQFAYLDFEALERRCVMDEVETTVAKHAPVWKRLELEQKIGEFKAQHGREPLIQVIGRGERLLPAGRPSGLTPAQADIEGQRLKDVFLGRQAVPVESITQGDKVFMTGDTTPRTVLYVHVSDLFVSLVIISPQDAMPFMVHRHRGGLINKEAN